MQVRLVRPDDREYREWCRRHRLRASDDRPRDPFAQEYSGALFRWEQIVRQLLTESVPAVAAERILVSFNRPVRGQRTSYLELDFVAGSGVEPRLFVEIKLRERTHEARTGWAQLHRSLTAARTRWPRLQGFCVCVAMGEILQTETERGVQTIRAADLAGRLVAGPGADGEVLWLEGREVAAFGIDSQLVTEAEVQRLPEQRLDMLHPVRVLERLRQQAGV